MGANIKFVETHLSEFARRRKNFVRWKGRNEKDWVKSICSEVKAEALLNQRRDRIEIRAFCQEQRGNPQACALACMAWGGMRISNGKDAWMARERWLPIVADLIEGRLLPKDAYKRFAEVETPGLGPAFSRSSFTFFRLRDKVGTRVTLWTNGQLSPSTY